MKKDNKTKKMLRKGLAEDSNLVDENETVKALLDSDYSYPTINTKGH